MTDQPIDKPQAGDTEQPTNTNGKTAIDSLPPDIQQYIESLRTEAATHRKAQKAAEAASKAAEEKRLSDQQEWKTLADNRAAELEKLQPVADQYETITQAFNASLDNRLKLIPEDTRKELVDPVRAGMSPVDFSNWLDKNGPRLQARTAPNMDAGAGGHSNGSSGKPVTLTPQDIEMARAFNMTPEQWAKRKEETKALRSNPYED